MKNRDLIKEINLIKVWKENELKGDSDNVLSDNEETKPRLIMFRTYILI